MAGRPFVIAFTLTLVAFAVFWRGGLLDRVDQSEEGQGFVSQNYQRHADNTWRSRTPDDASIWRDVDGDRTPDVHEWIDESGAWMQDTRDYLGGKPRAAGLP